VDGRTSDHAAAGMPSGDDDGHFNSGDFIGGHLNGERLECYRARRERLQHRSGMLR
jgi:hypothetical protein